MSIDRKTEELIDIMEERNNDVFSLSESKWKGQGKLALRDGDKLFWWGNGNIRENGMATTGGLVTEVKHISVIYNYSKGWKTNA